MSDRCQRRRNLKGKGIDRLFCRWQRNGDNNMAVIGCTCSANIVDLLPNSKISVLVLVIN
ncbi:methyltransferase protein [Candidatus Regiella insecticola]|uniref:Methyltransferase protein n=1 Tax=Candidatus Regiella insecticola TaxID=138073 RepID=A0A6L2ZMN6_9ENTR|nr:methyltransferase protein [Candidatus Regiella insecticola]